MVKTKLLGVAGITFVFFAIVSPAYSQTQGGDKPKAKLFDDVIKKDSGDVEYPFDVETYNELEAEARHQRSEELIESDRERFGANPKREQSIRDRETDIEDRIRARPGLPEPEPNLPIEPIPGHPGYFRGGHAPTPESANEGSSFGVHEGIKFIDEEQDIRQDVEDLTGHPVDFDTLAHLTSDAARREWEGQASNIRSDNALLKPPDEEGLAEARREQQRIYDDWKQRYHK
jgi:hypothetical protein